MLILPQLSPREGEHMIYQGKVDPPQAPAEVSEEELRNAGLLRFGKKIIIIGAVIVATLVAFGLATGKFF